MINSENKDLIQITKNNIDKIGYLDKYIFWK